MASFRLLVASVFLVVVEWSRFRISGHTLDVVRLLVLLFIVYLDWADHNQVQVTPHLGSAPQMTEHKESTIPNIIVPMVEKFQRGETLETGKDVVQAKGHSKQVTVLF
ncbi:hypothetical protein SCHPADRAFT_896370 [Schizopora paradoxa]|uniref:Uncharacterized protein n=1 Tax=Schizopora paradoxa TaxID=27342 RepID=A0A0H2R0J6_9AGAM|nr:hypothetical protein SCHPADRAFT_896370 [Schizopora paradoxa]